jgi:NhaP-type Na+/H+ or K+/H+ antiporter
VRRQDNHTRTEFPLTRWSTTPVILGLAVGVLGGPFGLKLLEPHIPEDSGLVESVSQIALLVSLFCVGLRLRIPFEWASWRVAVRLGTVTFLATALLAGAVVHLLFDFGFLNALILGIVLAPTDAVLASDIHVPGEGDTDSAAMVLAAEGALTSATTAPLVALGLAFVGVGEGTSGALGWPVLELLWSLTGALVVGWLIGMAMSRWIRMLDTDRQGDFLEEMIVFVTAALAYTCALALRTEGLLAVFVSGLALSHGGRFRISVRRYSLGSRVLKLAGRVERLATVVVMVLVGALIASVDFYLRAVLFALAVMLFLRPLAVRLGLGRLSLNASQRRPLEWFGARGAASLYCVAIAINHGLGTSVARELAAITLVFIVTSIVFSAVSALSLRRASPGAVDL